ncbi:uncharacterized protein YuzE [Arthrobacter stackebrandtii]|uniref:Uncharacterized protein YuzE n=1 Tax=Arthrobacter stackebrandtii TaxID=272161 RepID=A0ABS4YTK6_9MICC|nr:DUF2283 domain-containing protein [Arthrobacter stackebrandtii]MBP2412064.1 uncharacterized protein YuzE [Arthrobacter stackebrandtii]PYG98828.1 hypothetical protein CVV67_18310 [Arthrobacter stackebrandtii]
MEITYDSQADAAYIRIGGPIADGQATQQLNAIETPGGNGEITLDFDDAGHLLGVEVLFASSVLAPDVLTTATKMD